MNWVLKYPFLPFNSAVILAHQLRWECQPPPFIFTKGSKNLLVTLVGYRPIQNQMRQNITKNTWSFCSRLIFFWSFLELSSRILFFFCTWLLFLIMTMSWSHILPSWDISFFPELVKKLEEMILLSFCSSLLLPLSLSIMFCSSWLLISINYLTLLLWHFSK